MADDDPWILKEDGYLYVDTECKSIVYHPNLNVLLITTGSGQVYVFDVNFGVVLQRSSLSGISDGKLQGVYLAEGVDKVLYTDGRGIGVRSDYNGVLLLDTILQTPVMRSEDVIKIELLLSEAILLNQCLRHVAVPGVEHVQEVIQELTSKIHAAQGTQKKGIKAQKWNTICLELPHVALKVVCSGLVAELEKQKKHIPALPIASAINERLNGLLPGLMFEGGPADQALMFSEAARRETFSMWPHMNYKWALPGQMAQAGFFHEPNSTAHDRAMCFTCNVCLVCWEPTDEPWSEHERHLPTCPFVKGEYTQNVPLSVTLATAPARESSESVDVIGTTNVAGLVATASHKGLINVWNISNQLKGQVSFGVVPRCQDSTNNKETIEFYASRNTSSSFLSNLTSCMAEKDGEGAERMNLTALSIVRGPKSNEDESIKASLNDRGSQPIKPEAPDLQIRPCLVCGVSVRRRNSPNLRTLENVWASSTDLAASSSLVRAMNSVNSATSDPLDIMKVADRSPNYRKHHYLVLFDFHEKALRVPPSKEESGKAGKLKKTSISGTGTSASSNGGRQESAYQEMYVSKFLYGVPVIEDVDCEMVGVGTHFDGIFQTPTPPASSTNPWFHSSAYGVTPNSYDANFNPINSEQFPSTSDISGSNKKSLEFPKNGKNDPVVVQTFSIEADSSLKISYVGATKDARHLYVSLCPIEQRSPSPSPSPSSPEVPENASKNSRTEICPTGNAMNPSKMDIDEETVIFSPKSPERMYWDQNCTDVKLSNGQMSQESSCPGAILLIYALDFTGKVVKVIPEPICRRVLPPEQAPVEHEFLPLQDKRRGSAGVREPEEEVEDSSKKSCKRDENAKGQIALVCKDGIVRILDLANLKTVNEARPGDRATKFISAAYCNSLERLCVCSSDGELNFFAINDEEDSTEEKDEESDDVNMITEAINSGNSEPEVAGTSHSSADIPEPIIANRANLSDVRDLRNLYELTRFDRHSPAYGATVPSCWNEMMQAQRQRRHPQHLHRSEDQHHTRTWRLQNDTTTWDEHIFELTLPRLAAGSVGHVDVRFNLHWPCLELPTIQVTLLKQKITGLGYQKSPLTPVDDRIDFSLDSDQKGENPIISEEYQRQHNTEILCGPINLQKCTDLSDHSGCVTLTSPKLFSTKARTLLVHIKALIDPAKDAASAKSRVNLLETKPPTSKKLRIDEVGPFLPGAAVERMAAGPSKKLGCYMGCDWIHEISITVRSVQSTSIPNERLQRIAMLDSLLLVENLLNVACLQSTDKSLVAQSLALDILIWVTAIKLTRLRVGQNSPETRSMQLDTVRCVQEKLAPLLRTCFLHAGRSIAHKCVKLIVICSEGVHNTDDPNPHSFDEAVLSVLVNLLPSVVSVQWAGSLRWLALLITRLLPLDRNHGVAQQCVNLVQQIAAEMSNRVNPYHLLLATRFGLYSTPFETELFDIEPPMPSKSSSMPVTYATILTGEQASTSVTTANNMGVYTQDAIDLRDLLTLPSHTSGQLVVPSKLKTLSTNHSMKGLLEVEPLHFTCHAASDGTKMEKIDPGANVVNMSTALFDTSTATNNVVPELKPLHHTTYSLVGGPLVPNLQAKIGGKLSNLLSQCTVEMTKKAAPQLSLTPDDQSDSDEGNNMTSDNPIWQSGPNNTSNSHIVASTVTKEKTTIANVGSNGHKVEDSGIKKREDVTFPWGRLLCWPPQQALVVERMHSGARRFVVLDFGSPIMLTDLMIPSCSDLVTLSIDIWTKNEECDGTRLVVAGDICTKPLVVNDLQPPPLCRYLKITTIGRYGMSTTRCKIALGMFYGHMVGLPGEDYSEANSSLSNTMGNSDSTVQATIETQCSILSALAEDVQCRFSLATERLKSLLDPLLCTETPNVMHMQHYLSRSKNSEDDKEQPSAKILSTYQECIMFQHQLNIVRGVWRRLESWRGPQVAPVVSLANASSDKLRVLGETLLDILLYTVYEIGPVPSLPASLCDVFTPATCEAFFHSVCVVTPAPRLQLHAAALLARMAGHQSWWGNFLANTLVNLYSTSSTHIFPQDRVFILLTFLGRKSLIAGANKSSVVDAMVRTLGPLLAPLSNGQSTSSSSNSLDTILIGWVLLFLSCCLDTTTQQSTCLEENADKSKDQGVSSRWEFLQGESAMQRKYVSASRTSASRNYRRKLQKRLMHHKQQLQDIEQVTKFFAKPSQGQGLGSPAQISTISNKLEAALKNQERFFKKTLKQHSSKHLKDRLSMRRNAVSHLGAGSRHHLQAGSSRSEPPDIDHDCMANLSHQHVLPVARGLVALILNNAANVDMFLLGCKVVARLVVSTRPAISLGELMTEDQLLRLVILATGTSDSAWSSHAVSCLLQDLLEGGRLFPRPSQSQEGSQSEETFEGAGSAQGGRGEDDPAGMAGTSRSSTAIGNDEGFAEGDGDEDTQDSIVSPHATASTSKSNGFNLPSVLESDSELEDFLDDILERGKNTLKKGTVSKVPTSANIGSISLAIDARLEYGIESGVEIALRRLSTLGAYNLPLSINATVQIPPDSSLSAQQPSPRSSSWPDRNQEMWNVQDVVSSLAMLTRCFDKIFTYLSIQQNTGTSLELVLQLWLTLNLDANLDQSSSTSQFDPCLTPVIPLSPTAVSSLISALLWQSGVSLRAWCLALQTLTLACNGPLPSDHADSSIDQSMDGVLDGMASCIIKDRNMGPMFLRLLSGNGLNVEPRDKQYMMAGPRVAFALQDFLGRLEVCDAITPENSSGNQLKELLLWVVYQLVQPGGALVARRGPLDAQCILITSLINRNFTNTDLGTAMSISECVGVLVSTYVRGARVGAQCVGIADCSQQTGSFGGLFSCVLGAGSKQGRPTSWDTLVVALIKLVCRLVQTPLTNARVPRHDSTVEMEVGEASERAGTSSSDPQTKLNTSQTDESKVAEQQTSMRQQQQQTTAPKPRYPCVADTVLQHAPTMMRLLGALGHSTGFSLAMLFEGEKPELRDPASIPDATFELLTTLMKKATSPTLVLNPLYRYLRSSSGENSPDRHLGVKQLSEPLLWYILKVLDNEESVAAFTAMGGIEVLCENLVNSNSASPSGGLSSPGVIGLVMQHLSNAPNIAASTSTSSKKLESGKDNLLNFAPLGTVSWVKPMVEPADVLIQSTSADKRGRTAAWSYHFFPGEGWVDLTITLPCAILLKEVELQPHLSSLATCPSAVALEISREGNSDLTPVCPPMPTAGLTLIQLTLSQPEVATSVLVRLYKPRDCTNISLSQIKILGTTAFGEIKAHNETIDEEQQLTKTSFGWLRLLHQCLSVSSLSSNLDRDVLNSAASVNGLIEACCSLLLLRPRSLYTPNLERVLLQLGLHSRELGLQLINLLLNNRCTPLFQGTCSSRKSSTVQLIVELLQQLCSYQDSNTESRIRAVLDWLQSSATSALARPSNPPNFVSPPAVYVHCVASIVWKAHDCPGSTYNLEALLPDKLFNSLYEWTLSLGSNTALKLAIDAALCSLCYVRPSLFPLLLQKVGILVPNLATDHSASISDDRKESEGQTDDHKSENDAEEWYCRLVLPDQKRLQLTEGQLLTVAAAARSSPGIQQLIDSGLPAMLSATITDFCKLEKTKRYGHLLLDEERLPSTSDTSMTDSDKAGEMAHQLRNSTGGLCMSEPESIAIVLEFLSVICSEGRMRDWLGKEGRDFWLPLVLLLSNRRIESPSASSPRINVSYASLESAMIKFLLRCCWCHPNNQKLLSELLTNVILQHRTSPNFSYLHGISSFTRRLILQLLLEGEKVLVSVSSEIPMTSANSMTSHNTPSMPPHPAHPLGHYHQLLYMSTRSTVEEILEQVYGGETNASGTSSGRRDIWETGTALIEATFNFATKNLAKDKRTKEASNRSQARGPTLRKSRLNLIESPIVEQGISGTSASQQYLVHPSLPRIPLPPQMTIAELLAMAEDNGVSLSEPCIQLTLKEHNKDSKDETPNSKEVDLLNYRSIESALGDFSAGGGLAILAKHLPLIYPDSGRPPPFLEKSPSPEQQVDGDWVKFEVSDETYVDHVESGISARPVAPANTPAPQVPSHSLAAFGLFLRLPGYAEVLLRNREHAQSLLRLALGVTDDGEGGDILASPLSISLPTLPFLVLKQLLEGTPPTTDDGLLLRKTTIEIGAVLLLLNCLAIFTHQAAQCEDSQGSRGPGQSEKGRSDDKSHLYWAKGTGYGTGSTQQSWNVEQALLRQRSEEEHVTVLLQVLASYVGSGDQPQRDLPTSFTDLIARSCLLPALSSYLRNDSVLDMARHIPLYRAILQLLRAMALSNQLAPLLLPRGPKNTDASIVSLLYTMRVCVDAYVYKINRTRGNAARNVPKYQDDAEQDEGLATLIPDIQESATIVQNATSRLNVSDEELAGPSPAGPDLPLRSVEQRYLEVMKKLQFDTFEIIVDNMEGCGYKFAVSYHFESNMRTAGDRSHPARVKRLAQEAVTLSHALPLSYSSSVFVRCDADRLDIMKVLITGPAETPYANGCFEFDVYFPPDYPNSPMMINLETTGRHSVRFNPNLYNDGKVCLSVLNTWHGRPEEKWNAHTSSFLQVLVSIQSLILVPEPYFNEPGYERSRGTPTGAQSSQEYNANICQATVKWAMLDQIKNPCPCFKEVIHTHFWIKRHEIIKQLQAWIMEMELHSSDRRSSRNISLNALALRRHYRLLRDELNKLPTPEGLKDLVEPLPSPGSPLELSGLSGTPSTPPPTSTMNSTSSGSGPSSTGSAENGNANGGQTSSNVLVVQPVSNSTVTSNHVHHDIDIDVEMEKMVSKVCE